MFSGKFRAGSSSVLTRLFVNPAERASYIAERTDPEGSITCCNHLNCIWTCLPNFDKILELILSD